MVGEDPEMVQNVFKVILVSKALLKKPIWASKPLKVKFKFSSAHPPPENISPPIFNNQGWEAKACQSYSRFYPSNISNRLWLRVLSEHDHDQNSVRGIMRPQLKCLCTQSAFFNRLYTIRTALKRRI